MFTDVKNLVPNQVLNMSTIASKRKEKGAFYKFFKPFLRMLRTVKNNSNCDTGSNAHPNNINLNNSSDLRFIAPTLVETLGQGDYENYEAIITKVTKDEKFLQSYFEDDPFNGNSPYALDSSVAISEPATACSCTHGYNCQQYHGQFNKKYSDYCQIPVIKKLSVDDCFIPVHYIRTENGTFFWTAQQTKLDADLIEPLYCNSDQQQAQSQWDNRALLY